MKSRLLFVTIQALKVRTLPDRLTAEGYRVDVADNERTALLLAGLQDYEAIILDTAHLEPGGMAMVRQLRQKRIAAPILILSARGTVAERVAGLDAGADDYLSMPFSMPELLARLRALLRRRPSAEPTRIHVADLELDRVNRQARRGGEPIDLTPREFALLELLMSASPAAVSKVVISDRLWHKRLAPRSNVVNVLVNTIRRKIQREHRPPLLHTVRGVGFCCRSLL